MFDWRREVHFLRIPLKIIIKKEDRRKFLEGMDMFAAQTAVMTSRARTRRVAYVKRVRF